MIKSVSFSQPNLQKSLPKVEPKQRESTRETIIEQQDIQHKKESKKDIEKVVNGINEFLKPSNTHLKFEFHDDLQEYYVTVVDDETKEVIREIPSRKLMDMYAAMTEYLGLLVDKKV